MGEMEELVICFDFDGTLVDSESHIHPRDVEILGSEIPFALIPATGRPLHAVRHVLRKHGLFEDLPIPFPLVLENGAAVYESNEKQLAQYPLVENDQENLMEIMLASPQVTFLLFSLDTVRMLWPSYAGRQMVKRFGLTTQPFSREGADEPLTKVVSVSARPELLRDFASKTVDMALERAYSLPTVLEVTRLGVDKGRSLDVLLRDRPAGTKLVVAGDGENDLPLFNLADLAFAPEDSPSAIRSRADRVIDTYEEGLLTPILREVGFKE